MDEQQPSPGEGSGATHEERGVASAIYGLVVCSATLAAAAVSGRLWFVAISVLVTLVVYWVAESYAHALARQAVRQAPLGWSDLRAILRQGWPMVTSSLAPLGALLLTGALGASVFVAVNVSLAVATVLLIVAGWSASKASGLRGWRLITSTGVSAAFGLTMVGLKNLLH